MTVHRLTPLSVGTNRGRLLVPAAVAAETRCVLQGFRGCDGPHEGLAYWLGRRIGDDALVLSVIVPRCDHGPQHVFIAECDVGPMSRQARAFGLAVVAQVHSHPGTDTRHSDGDDELILLPASGMFSLVVPRYGYGGIAPAAGAGLHQFQDGRWVYIPVHANALLIIPTLLVPTHE